LFWSLDAISNIGARRATGKCALMRRRSMTDHGAYSVNRKRLYQLFNSGVAELEPVLRSILSPQTLADRQSIARLSDDDFPIRMISGSELL